jgi:hypothetical protein
MPNVAIQSAILLPALLTISISKAEVVPLQNSITVPVKLSGPTLQALETDGDSKAILTAYTDGKTSEIFLYDGSQTQLSHFAVPFVVFKSVLGSSIVLSHRLKTADLRFEVCKFSRAGKLLSACIQDDGLVERLFTLDDKDYAIVGRKTDKAITRQIFSINWTDQKLDAQGIVQIPSSTVSLLSARKKTFLSADVYTGLADVCNATNMSCQSVSLVAPAMQSVLKDRTAGEALFRDIVLTDDRILVLRGRQNAYVGVVIDHFDPLSLSYLTSSTFAPTIFADLRRGNDTTGHSWITGFTVVARSLVTYDQRAPHRLLWYNFTK